MKEIFINTNDEAHQNVFGVFETMRFINGKINFEELHFERLFAGMKRLRINRSGLFTIEKIRMEIEELCKKNKCYQKGRVKLTVLQSGNGDKSSFEYFIEALSLNEDGLNDEGLIVDIFLGDKKNCDTFSDMKIINRALYEKAEKFAAENKLDDCLILNEHDRICETTIANIFWIKDGIIYTPPLSEGCVAGVMRRFLMEKMRDAGYRIREKSLVIEELVEADEVFLTNAIRGIRWVKEFRNKIYTNERTLKIKNEFLPENFFT